MSRGSTNLIASAAAVAILLGLSVTDVAAGTFDDELLQDQLSTHGSAGFFVKFDSEADVEAATQLSNRIDRATAVYELKVAHAASSQQGVRAYLDDLGVAYEVLWINNSLFIPSGDFELAATLADMDGVAYLRANHEVPLDLPVARYGAPSDVDAVEWGVAKINADDVWGMGHTGEGVVVANIDTGVRWTHEALQSSYRGGPGDHDYNWYDPTGFFPDAPGDNDGHGTHTMGTMVGGDGLGPFSNDIGVAPDAMWIAAKGCETNSCSDIALIKSAQFIACPHDRLGNNPDCSKIPDIVNNSWGGSGGNPWYESYVRSWIQMGILPVFSIGNAGSNCNTAGSPGDYRLSFGVGSTTSSDVLSSFSSKGPGVFRPLKPDIVAPGSSVRSSYRSSDTSYAILSGTSMAAPHIAGAAALLLSADPSLRLIEIYRALTRTTDQGLGNPPGPDECGGRHYTQYPNAIYGFGQVDVLAAINWLP